MVPQANPKACWGVWDETGVTKAKSQPYVALPTVPGSLDAPVHCFSYMELRPSERNNCPQLHSRAKPEWPLLSSVPLGWAVGPTGHIRAKTY